MPGRTVALVNCAQRRGAVAPRFAQDGKYADVIASNGVFQCTCLKQLTKQVEKPFTNESVHHLHSRAKSLLISGKGLIQPLLEVVAVPIACHGVAANRNRPSFLEPPLLHPKGEATTPAGRVRYMREEKDAHIRTVNQRYKTTGQLDSRLLNA